MKSCRPANSAGVWASARRLGRRYGTGNSRLSTSESKTSSMARRPGVVPRVNPCNSQQTGHLEWRETVRRYAATYAITGPAPPPHFSIPARSRASMTTAAQALDLLPVALDYRAGGMSLVPCSAATKLPEHEPTSQKGARGDKVEAISKENGGRTKRQSADGSTSEVTRAVAGIEGKVSGSLLVFDFDEARFLEAWLSLMAVLATGCRRNAQAGGSGSYQVWLRCPKPGRNDKLAYVPDDITQTTASVVQSGHGRKGAMRSCRAVCTPAAGATKRFKATLPTSPPCPRPKPMRCLRRPASWTRPR